MIPAGRGQRWQEDKTFVEKASDIQLVAGGDSFQIEIGPEEEKEETSESEISHASASHFTLHKFYLGAGIGASVLGSES